MKFLLMSIIVISAVASEEECGQRKSINPLVFGGTAVIAGDFPWVVPLIRKFNNKFFCGSNLISRQHVLTGKSFGLFVAVQILSNIFFSCPLRS